MFMLRVCFLILAKALSLLSFVHGTFVLDENSAMENWFPHSYVTSVGVVRSTSECVLHCYNVGWCVSIVYDSANDICYLNDVVFTTASNGYWRPNTSHFQVKSGLVGYDCNAFTGSCVNISSSLLSWNDAFDVCETKGERLLLIDNADKQLEAERFMQDHGFSYLWIGLTDQATEGVWLDNEGNPMVYNNFVFGQPDNSGNYQHCAYIKPSQGYQWDDCNCDAQFNFVCEMI